MRAADKQWVVTKGVRDRDPDLRPASAGMHDEAQALVPEDVESPWHERLWGCRPGSDPPLAVGEHSLRGTDRGLCGMILRHRWDGQQSDEGAGHTVRNQSVHGAGSAETSCCYKHIWTVEGHQSKHMGFAIPTQRAMVLLVKAPFGAYRRSGPDNGGQSHQPANRSKLFGRSRN